MNSTIVAFAGALAASAALAAAQAPTTQPEPETTIVGCLRGATNPTMEIKGTIYTLEPIKEATDPPATSAGRTTSEAAGAAAKPRSGSSYTLVAPPAVGLDKHVGHQVQLTGRLQSAPPKASSGAERAESEATDKPRQAGGAHNTFMVSGLKMIAPTCP